MRIYSIGLFGMFWLLASPASAAVSCATAMDDAQAYGDDLAGLQAFVAQVDRECRHGDVSKTTGDVLGRAHFDAFRAATDEDARVHHVKSAIECLRHRPRQQFLPSWCSRMAELSLLWEMARYDGIVFPMVASSRKPQSFLPVQQSRANQSDGLHGCAMGGSRIHRMAGRN